MASWSTCEGGLSLPRDRLITLAGFAFGREPGIVPPAAHRIPAATSLRSPPPFPRTRTGRILQFQSTPATPILLLLAAPIVPATWVPCQDERPLGWSPPWSVGSLLRPTPFPARTGSLIMLMPG